MTETRKRSQWKKVIIISAAVLVLAALSAVGFKLYTDRFSERSVISLDVNPSIEIKISKTEHVVQVNALNDRAKTVIGEMELEGCELDVAVNALIGSMLKNGIISENANSVLVSVEGKDKTQDAELSKRLSEDIAKLLQGDGFTGAVLSQTVTSDSELEELAKKHNISTGKAELIKKIADGSTVYTEDALAPLSVNELNLLYDSTKVVKNEGLNKSGAASDKGYIGKEAALKAALDHIGITQNDIRDIEIEMDFERGVMAYEVEFEYKDRECEFDINAADGSIFFTDYDRDQVKGSNVNGGNGADSKPATGNTSSSSTASSSKIDKATAKNKALAHSGVSASSIRDYECELDEDDGRYVYEIEFKSGGYEYEYEISAKDGSVVKSKKDKDD